jgi:hypothetical protein
MSKAIEKKWQEWWVENGKRCRGWKYKKSTAQSFEAGFQAAREFDADGIVVSNSADFPDTIILSEEGYGANRGEFNATDGFCDIGIVDRKQLAALLPSIIHYVETGEWRV